MSSAFDETFLASSNAPTVRIETPTPNRSTSPTLQLRRTSSRHLYPSDLRSSVDKSDDDQLIFSNSLATGMRGRASPLSQRPFLHPGVGKLGKISGIFPSAEEDWDSSMSSLSSLDGLTKDQAAQILQEYSRTLTVEAATKLDKTFQAKISGSDIGDKKQFEQNGNKVAADTAGRMIHDAVINLIKSCGKEVMLAVFYNLAIEEWIHLLSAKMQSTSNTYEELESRATQHPGTSLSEDYFKVQSDLEFEDKKALLLAAHIKTWKQLLEYDVHVAQLQEEAKMDGVTFTPPSPPSRCFTVLQIVHEESGTFMNFDSKQSSELTYRDARVYANTHMKEFKRLAPTRYAIYNSESKELKEHLTLKSKRGYIDNVKYHLDKVNRLNSDKEKFGKLKAKRSELETFKQLNIALSTAIQLIGEKLRTAVKHYPEIVTKLHATVLLEKTQEVIHDSYNLCSLAGMLEILRKEFACANFVTVKHKLLEVMNLKLSRDQMEGDPTIGIQSIQRHINTWKSMQLFDYLNEDIFWTVIFLSQYDTSTTIYQRSIERTMEHLHRVQSGDPAVSTNSTSLIQPGMPVLSDLFEWLQQVFRQSLQYGSRNNKRNGNNGGDGKNNDAAQPYQQRTRFAKTYPNNQEQWANVAQETKFAQTQMLPAAASYDREIVRNEKNIGVKSLEDPTKWHLYTATRVACTKCVGSDKTHSKPYCYLGRCKKCKYFGHQDKYCLQTKSNPAQV